MHLLRKSRFVLLALIAEIACTIAGAQTLTPESFSIGSVGVGVPYERMVYLRNTSDVDIQCVQVIQEGVGRADVQWRHQGNERILASHPIPLKPGGFYVLRLTVIPKNVGLLDQTSTMILADMQGNRVDTLNFRITATIDSEPKVSVSTSMIDFGVVDVAATARKSLVIKNDGTGSAFLKGIHSRRGFYTDGQIIRISAGDSVTYEIRITPTVEGLHSDTLKLVYLIDGIGMPLEVRLQAEAAFPSSGLVADRNEDHGFILCDDQHTSDTNFIECRAGSSAVVIEEVRLAAGMSYSLLPQQLPTAVEASGLVNVGVVWRPKLDKPYPYSEENYRDTLILTTLGGTLRIPLVGNICVGVNQNADDVCLPYPNPAFERITWCARALDQWRIANSLGDIIAHITADIDGRCEWRGEQAGVYMLVSERTGIATPIVIYK